MDGTSPVGDQPTVRGPPPDVKSTLTLIDQAVRLLYTPADPDSRGGL